MNSVNLIGRLVAAPEMKVSSNDIKIAIFSVAVSRDFKNKEGKYDTDFFRCVAYRSLAERMEQYTKKGDLIGVSGSLRQNHYERDGKKFSSVEILAEKVKFLTPKNSGNKDEREEQDSYEALIPPDDVPF